MKSSTAFNHQQRLKSMLRNHYSMHLSFKSPHEAMMENKKKIWDDPGYKRCPQHVKSFLSGYDDARWEMYWMNLEWVMPFKGVNYKKWDELPEEGQEHYKQKDVSGCHVYKGTDKRFNEPKGEV